jgi:hypothetical protein
MTRLIQCEVNDLEHTEFGHTILGTRPGKKVACAKKWRVPILETERGSHKVLPTLQVQEPPTFV